MTYMMFVWPVIIAAAIYSIIGALAVRERVTGLLRIAGIVWALGSAAIVIYGLVELHGEVSLMFPRIAIGMVIVSLFVLGFLGAFVVSVFEALARRFGGS